MSTLLLYPYPKVHMLAPEQIRDLTNATEEDWSYYIPIPRCSTPEDMACPYDKFKQRLLSEINPECVDPQQLAFIRSLSDDQLSPFRDGSGAACLALSSVTLGFLLLF